MGKKAGYGIYRITTVGLGLFLLGSSFLLLARGFTYFKTGADPSDALNFLKVEASDHSPTVVWLPENLNDGRKLDNYNKRKIQRDYLFAWKTWNYSLNKGLDVNLKEHFSLPPRNELLRLIDSNKNFAHERVDLQHHIQPHLFSLDGTFLSFTDKAVRTKFRFRDKESGKLIYSGEEVSDYDVILVLKDGHWRIHQMVKKESSSETNDTLNQGKPGLIRVDKNLFEINQKTFLAHGVNYYPQKNPWFDFWINYNQLEIEKDLDKINDLNINVVRIFLQYETWGKGVVDPIHIKNLGNFLTSCQLKNIHVIVTLFDFYSDYSLQSYTATESHLEAVVTPFKEHPAILAWDIKNEPDLDFKRAGEQQVKEWLKYMCKRIRIIDPNHLVTIGWAYPENAHILHEKLDFVSFHYYRDISKLRSVIEELRTQIPEKLLFLEEFGLSTYRLFFRGNTEHDQTQYYTTALQVCSDLQVSRAMWTLYDFDQVPSNIAGKGFWLRKTQSRYGLLRKNGKPKHSTTIIKEQ